MRLFGGELGCLRFKAGGGGLGKGIERLLDGDIWV